MTKYPLVPGTSAEFEKTVARLVETQPIMSNKIPGSYVTMPGGATLHHRVVKVHLQSQV